MDLRYLIVLYFLLPFGLLAQTKSYSEIDSLSLEYYQSFNYSALKQTGEEAIKNKIDFYELRTRLAITYFRLGDFERAVVHLMRAIEMNPSDVNMLNYAYWSLIYTAQFERANILLLKYPAIHALLQPKEKGLFSVEFEPGTLFTSNESNFEGKVLHQSGANYAAGNFFSGMNYLRMYAQGLNSPYLRWHLGVQLFQTQHLSKYELIPATAEKTNSNTNFQINLGWSKIFDKGWAGGVAASYYQQGFSHYTQVKNIPLPPPPNRITDTIETYRNISMGVYVSKRMKFIEPVLFLNYNNFDLRNRFQAELGITCFPLSSSKFYSYSSVSYINLNSSSDYAYQQKLGYAPNGFFSSELSYLGGNLENYMGALGFLTLNTFDPVQWSLGWDLNFRIHKITLGPGYRFQKRKGMYELSSPTGTIDYISNSYFNHLLFITVKCQF